MKKNPILDYWGYICCSILLFQPLFAQDVHWEMGVDTWLNNSNTRNRNQFTDPNNILDYAYIIQYAEVPWQYTNRGDNVLLGGIGLRNHWRFWNGLVLGVNLNYEEGIYPNYGRYQGGTGYSWSLHWTQSEALMSVGWDIKRNVGYSAWSDPHRRINQQKTSLIVEFAAGPAYTTYLNSRKVFEQGSGVAYPDTLFIQSEAQEDFLRTSWGLTWVTGLRYIKNYKNGFGWGLNFHYGQLIMQTDRMERTVYEADGVDLLPLLTTRDREYVFDGLAQDDPSNPNKARSLEPERFMLHSIIIGCSVKWQLN